MSSVQFYIPRYLFAVFLLFRPDTSLAQIHDHDSLLSLLRGKWECRTFHDTRTLDFLSDSDVIVDRHLMSYEIDPVTFRLTDSAGASWHTFRLEGDRLAMSLTEGGERAYRRVKNGCAEERIEGFYFFVIDSGLSTKCISFDGGHTFHLHADFPSTDPDSEKAQRNGLYRVAGNDIILLYDDGVMDLGLVSGREKGGHAFAVRFGNASYELEPPGVSTWKALIDSLHALIRAFDHPDE